MLPTNLRNDLQTRLGISQAQITRRAQALAREFGPMSTDDAKMIMAHEAGLRLLDYVPLETVNHIRGLRVDMAPRSVAVRERAGRAASADETPSIVDARPPTRRAQFEAREFHPIVSRASRRLFGDGHLALAVSRAFIATNNRIKRLSSIQQDGQGLMSTVFSDNGPALQMSSLTNQSDVDEHRGLRFLAMGGMTALRNVPTHEDDWRWAADVNRALECLAVASLLNHFIDACEAYQP